MLSPAREPNTIPEVTRLPINGFQAKKQKSRPQTGVSTRYTQKPNVKKLFSQNSTTANSLCSSSQQAGNNEVSENFLTTMKDFGIPIFNRKDTEILVKSNMSLRTTTNHQTINVRSNLTLQSEGEQEQPSIQLREVLSCTTPEATQPQYTERVQLNKRSNRFETLRLKSAVFDFPDRFDTTRQLHN